MIIYIGQQNNGYEGYSEPKFVTVNEPEIIGFISGADAAYGSVVVWVCNTETRSVKPYSLKDKHND